MPHLCSIADMSASGGRGSTKSTRRSPRIDFVSAQHVSNSVRRRHQATWHGLAKGDKLTERILKETRAAHRASATGTQLDSAAAAAENARQHVDRQQQLLNQAREALNSDEQGGQEAERHLQNLVDEATKEGGLGEIQQTPVELVVNEANPLATHQENLVAEAKVTLGPLVQGVDGSSRRGPNNHGAREGGRRHGQRPTKVRGAQTQLRRPR